MKPSHRLLFSTLSLISLSSAMQKNRNNSSLLSHKKQGFHCATQQQNRTHIRQRRLTALFNMFASNMRRYTCKYDRCLADNKRRRGDDTSSTCRKRDTCSLVATAGCGGVPFSRWFAIFFAPESIL